MNQKIKIILLLICTAGCINTEEKSSDSISQEQVDRLMAFARLYGDIKYFYPSDEAAEINWDLFAVYGVSQILQSKPSDTLSNLLLNIFSPIAPLLTPGLHIAKGNVIYKENITDTVSWQHLGIGFGSGASLYKSARINRPFQSVPAVGRGSFYIYVDSLNVLADSVKLSTMIRADSSNTKSYAFLGIRIEDNNKTNNSTMGHRFHSVYWDEYILSAKLPDNSRKIRIDIHMRDIGRFWIDNLNLSVKINDQWITVFNDDFESGVENVPYKKVEDERGYLSEFEGKPLYKQFISSREHFSGAKSLVISSDTVLTDTFAPLFEETSKLGEIVTERLNGNLTFSFPLVLLADSISTFPRPNSNQTQNLKVKLHELSKTQLTAENLNVRIANVINAWNVFKFFYPYTEEINLRWDELLREAIIKAVEDTASEDFEETLSWLVAQLEDGHGTVHYAFSKNGYFPPIELELVDGKIVVSNVHDSATNVRIGDVLNKIDNADALEKFERQKDISSGATDGYIDFITCAMLLEGEEGQAVRLQLQREGELLEFPITRSLKLNELLNHYWIVQEDKTIEEIDDNIMYVNLTTTLWKDLEREIISSSNQPKVLILDLRGYPYDNVTSLIPHILEKEDTSSAWLQIPKSINPKANPIGYKSSGWNFKPKNPKIDSKLYLLLNSSAISYSESLASFFEHYKLATIVGETTAGTNGNVNVFTLPGGYSINFTGTKVVKHDNSRFHGIGIQPDVHVAKTLKGVREGKDEVLETAIELARRQR